jgi:hypothetical protein
MMERPQYLIGGVGFAIDMVGWVWDHGLVMDGREILRTVSSIIGQARG